MSFVADEHAWPPAWIEVPMRWAVWVAVRALPPRGRGLRIAGAIDRLLPPSGRLFRAPLPGAFAISCDLRDPVQGCVFYRGLYEPEVVACLDEALRPGDVFLDIGANVGYFASIAGRRIGITGRVLAIEPAKDLAARLRSDVSAAGRRAAHVEVLEVALGDSSRDGTLLDVAGLNRAGERSLSVDEAGAAHGMHVRVCPLDELLPDLCFDVAKVDVEGAELQVLQGMVQAIRRSQPRLLLVEAIDDHLRRFDACVADVVKFLDELGYKGVQLPSAYFAPMIAFRPAP